jgi:hypothetical protein
MLRCGQEQHRLKGRREGGWQFGRSCNYKDFTSCCAVVKVSIDGKVRGGEELAGATASQMLNSLWARSSTRSCHLG